MEDDELNLITLAQKFSDEDAARTYLEEMRWPSGVPLCPFCGSERTEWKDATGRGTIYSYSVMRRVPVPYGSVLGVPRMMRRP